jgi:DNA-binding NarL/FixJ family response regulator
METAGNKLRILIADDSEVIRHALNDLLAQNSDGWAVWGEVNIGEDTVSEARRLRPDVVLLDRRTVHAEIDRLILSSESNRSCRRCASGGRVRHC